MMHLYIGAHGTITILDDPALQARLTALRTRVAGNAANRPIGRQIWKLLFTFEEQLKSLAKAQHQLRSLAEDARYIIEGISLAPLEEAERLNAEGKAQARAQGQTFPCAMAGCQQRVLTQSSLCPRCAHDEQ